METKPKISSFTVIVVFILLILCGMPLVYRLNLELNPGGRSSSLSVRFSWAGAEPRVIEQEATSKLEALFASVNGIKEISSSSGNGSGTVYLTLDKDADPDAIRFEVSTLIRQVWPEMPEGAGFPTLTVNRPNKENERPLLTYKLNAPQAPPVVQQYAEDHIRPLLSQVPGINKIEIYGAMPMEWVIEYDQEAMEPAGVTTEDIQKAVGRALKKQNLGTAEMGRPEEGRLETGKKETGKKEEGGAEEAVDEIYTMPVVLQAQVANGTDLLKVPVKKSGDRILYLSDVAGLKHAEAQPSGYYRINGLNTINILVYAGPGENSLLVGEKVKEEAEKLISSEKSGLPTGYELILSDDSTEYIYKEISNIAIRSACTFLILLVFILLVTRKGRHALLILLMLTGNLSIAVIFYFLFKLEIHLYALAGITVSLGLMTDNIIIMSDHLRHHGNRKAFLAIFAGTLATVSALVIIFFLKEQIKANLVDFALVIIINQSVSLLTALFVIPALMERLGLDKEHLNRRKETEDGRREKGVRRREKGDGRGETGERRRKRLRFIVGFTGIYQRVCFFLRRWKIFAILVYILGFGVPLYMLPVKWDGKNWYHKTYNNLFGSEWYRDRIKPWMDQVTGGALRLFTEKVFEGSYFRTPEETSLYITATMPRGTTLTQANDIVSGMETYLKQFSEIKNFQANITARTAYLSVYFKKEYQLSGFPYALKGEVISKAIDLGGADWSVYGFGDGFSNRISEGTGNYSIRMLGYDFDKMNLLAERLKDSLTLNPRIKQVYMLSENSYYKPDNTEFAAHVNKERAMIAGVSPHELFSSLQNWSLSQQAFTQLITPEGMESVRLQARENNKKDVWTLSRQPLRRDSLMYKFAVLSTVEKETVPPVISKINQQYQLFLKFDYIGSDQFARKYINEKVDHFKPVVPIGYSVSTDGGGRYYWNQQEKKQYWLLGLIVVMIFFICAVLFESLLQPFAVILTIPVAYIGIFLTFYLFGLNFDQGGFAALVMLTGITVNAAIYILNDFNNLKKEHAGRRISSARLYFKAFNYKIIPILLTVVSTVLGFVPFLIGERQTFWFALAAGTIGGLVFSLAGVIFYLPVFLGINERIKELKNEKAAKRFNVNNPGWSPG